MMVNFFVLTKGKNTVEEEGERHQHPREDFGKKLLLCIQQLPHSSKRQNHEEGDTDVCSCVSRGICECGGARVVNHLSCIVLDAKLVVSHSGLHIVRVCLERKDHRFLFRHYVHLYLIK